MTVCYFRSWGTGGGVVSAQRRLRQDLESHDGQKRSAITIRMTWHLRFPLPHGSSYVFASSEKHNLRIIFT